MKATINIPDNLIRNRRSACAFFSFLQLMANRRAVGSLRYEEHGVPDRRKLYLSRIRREIRAYSKAGNMENLLNVAVYCFLESEAPENKNFHWDSTADSATRAVIGGEVVRHEREGD